MRVLILGSGAREHTITWKFSQSNRISGLYISPGNAGTADLGDNVPDLDPSDGEAVSRFCSENRIDLVFVGPEAPLAAGLVDILEDTQTAVIGPARDAARLESSKTFAKEFMNRHGIPTATAVEFEDIPSFEKHIETKKGNLVIKKSGLAGGKGVLESSDKSELIQFGSSILESDKLLVEEYLKGWEISVFALTDGNGYLLMPPCADFKKAGEHDIGANTGGMGAICPVPPVSKKLSDEIERLIVRPTFEGMKEEGLTYRGILYFGLMITKDGPRLLEYNVRLGDPETQVLLPLIQSDFVNVCEAMLDSTIESFPLHMSGDFTVGVVVASQGYPERYKKGIRVESLPKNIGRQQIVFHASTSIDATGRLVTGGGRCFTVVGIGPTILSANKRAYEAVPGVVFEGAWFRHDIGKKFLVEDTQSDESR